jgi:hypothetical protein
LFLPVISYITFGILNLRPAVDYFMVIAVILGFLFLILKSNKSYTSIFGFAFLWFLYYSVQGFFLLERGLNTRILQSLSLCSILLIIQNIKFTSRYIQVTNQIIGISIIASLVVTLAQTRNFEFLNPHELWYRDAVFADLIDDMYNIRRSSIFGYVDQNELGLSFLPLFSIYLGHKLKDQKSKYLLLFIIAAGIVSLLSNTRYVIVGYLIVISQIFIYRRNSVSTILRMVFPLVIALIAIYFTLSKIGYNIDDWATERLFKENSITESTRYLAFRNFVLFFPEKPLLGHGYLTNSIEMASNNLGSSQIHVGYLSSLVYFGLFGSFILFGLWISIARSLYITAKKTNYWGSFFAFLVFLWANLSLVMFSLFYYGIIFALISDKFYKDNYLSSQNEASYG